MTTRLLTVTLSPENGGTLDRRIAAAMHPPVGVPAKGGPLTFALMALPELANVTVTVAVPVGSLPRRQDDAAPAAVRNAATAALRLNGAALVAAGFSVLATGAAASLVAAGSLAPGLGLGVEAPGFSGDVGWTSPPAGCAAGAVAGWSLFVAAPDVDGFLLGSALPLLD